MGIDALFVLSAGIGSRMGKIGETLPKPLWPIFEKTLLELQFNFYQWLNVEKKIINIHHQEQKVQGFIGQHIPDVQALYEQELLDVGGAIMNLKAYNPEINSILISNVDQFLCMDRKKLKDAINEIPLFDVILFAIPVDKTQGYRKLEVSEEGRLLGINPGPEEDRYLTYGGVALVNCTSIEQKPERLGFFQSIAHPENKRVKVVEGGDCRYYDFGTVGRYLKRIMALLDNIRGNTESDLLNLLKESDAIQFGKMNESANCYNSTKINEYQFHNLKINFGEEIRIESSGISEVINWD